MKGNKVILKELWLLYFNGCLLMLRLIQESSINDMAGLGVKLFLPALIIINLGEQLQLGNALNYIPVLSTAPPNYLGNQ